MSVYLLCGGGGVVRLRVVFVVFFFAFHASRFLVIVCGLCLKFASCCSLLVVLLLILSCLGCVVCWVWVVVR